MDIDYVRVYQKGATGIVDRAVKHQTLRSFALVNPSTAKGQGIRPVRETGCRLFQQGAADENRRQCDEGGAFNAFERRICAPSYRQWVVDGEEARYGKVRGFSGFSAKPFREVPEGLSFCFRRSGDQKCHHPLDLLMLEFVLLFFA